MTIKNLLIGLAVVVAGGLIVGAYYFPKTQFLAGSPAGTTFGTAKVAAVNISPQSRTSTSTSMLNSDASDRIVLDAYVTCSGLTNMFGADGAGVATFNWTAATSSVAAPTASIAANALAAMQITVATSSTEGYTATTTYTNVFARRWNSGSYMIFQTNATSSAATCQAGVHYVAL